MAYQAQLETIWRNLRPHIEEARGFTLVYLFTRHPAPVDFLRGRLADSLIIHSLPLRALPFNGPATVETTLNALLSSRPLNGQHPPIWLEMWRESNDADWQTALRQVLARLNERRFLLERDVDCPLVLVLPADLRASIANLAPDLWTVRAFTADLPMPETVIVQAEVSPATPFVPLPVEDETPDAAEREWRRLWDNTQDKQRIDIWMGVTAVDAALARMDISAAQRITSELMQIVRPSPCAKDADQRNLSFARRIAAKIMQIVRPSPSKKEDADQRNLSVALNKQGEVAKARGKLDDALNAYRESLEIRRTLRASTGDAPQTLRDLSVSLDNVGSVEQAL
ncbi:MAG: tetratricopeptide repeat protein, partial [Sulfuricellaceae bacterium]